jgi:hypothetical protein
MPTIQECLAARPQGELFAATMDRSEAQELTDDGQSVEFARASVKIQYYWLIPTRTLAIGNRCHFDAMSPFR